MEKNVCGLDRAVRALLGVLLLSVLIRSSGKRERDPRGTRADRSVPVRRLLLVYAIAELSINVFAQWCPLNALFGIDTCRTD